MTGRGRAGDHVRGRLSTTAGGVILGLAGIIVITWAGTRVTSLTDRPGPVLMADLLLVICVTLASDQVAGYATAAGAFLASDWFLARPLHSLVIDTAGVLLLMGGFAVAVVAITALVARLAVAHREAEAARLRADGLQRLTAAFSRARTAEAVYEVALAEGRELLAATGGLVALREETGGELRRVAALGLGTGRDDGGMPEELRTAAHEAIANAGPALHGAAGGTAPLGAAALVADGRVAGALVFSFADDRRLAEDDRGLLARLGEQCGFALERARLYDAERRAREALGILATIGAHLASSLDVAAALRTLAELVVPAVADQCIVDLLHDDGTIARQALVHVDSSVRAAAAVMERYPPRLEDDTPVANALRTGELQLVERVAALPTTAWHNEEHRAAVEQVRVAAIITAPMTVRGRIIGAITFGWREPRTFDPEEIDLVQQLARRLGIALDNGVLYQAAHGERERLSALVRQLPLGVVIASATGRELLANARAEEILGGRSDDPDAPHLAYVRQALAGRSVAEDELHLRLPDGGRRVVSVSAEPVRDASGAIVAAVATLFDLTEHRDREETLAFLADASELLSRSLDPAGTLADLAGIAVPRLADWCAIELADPGTPHVIEVAGVAPADEIAAILRRRGALAALPASSQLLSPVAPDPGGAHALLAALRARGIEPRSAIVAPLRARGRTLGTLTLVTSESERRYGEGDLRAAEDLARHAALAIDNARLFEAQHRIAHTLQQSLLPEILVQPPGLELAARYRPAGAGAEVGGDFYDAWPVDGGYAIAIGDVAGKGPAAAALTALTRHAMRVASRYERSPSRVLRVANDAIIGHDRAGAFCTAVLAIMRPDGAAYRITTSCAGHSPPLLLRGRTGTVETAGIFGTLLGADRGARFRDHTTQLEVGDALMFWTDGVTERRNSGRLFGEERLTELFAGLVGRSAEDIVRLVDEAVVGFAPGLPDDDVAILAARMYDPAEPVPGAAAAGHSAERQA